MFESNDERESAIDAALVLSKGVKEKESARRTSTKSCVPKRWHVIYTKIDMRTYQKYSGGYACVCVPEEH